MDRGSRLRKLRMSRTCCLMRLTERQTLRRLCVGAVLCGWLLIACAGGSAQKAATATRKVDFSVFGGLTGTFTGLSNGKNLGVTAGLDLSLPRHFGIRPSVEVRGTTPFVSGRVDTQKDILAGLRGELSFGRLHPYADFLIGRGAIHYVVPYALPGNFLLGAAAISGTSTTTVLSPGVGARFQLGGSFSVLGDVQLQRWDTPVTTSGHLFAKPFTAALVYRFGGGRRGR
jgi:hypothetical protein